jgi:hypothetical protein
MKQILLTSAIVMATASVGFADGLTQLGLDDPEVMAPPSVSGDWSGPYVGLSYGRTTKTTETYREWMQGNCKGSISHNGSKCAITKGMFDDLDLKEIKDPNKPDVTNPWNNAETGEVVKYHNLKGWGNYSAIWLGDATGREYTWELGENVPTTAELADLEKLGKGGKLSVTKMSETVTSVTNMDDFGAFVGYRKDWGRIVGGVELGVNGEITSLEAQAGLDLGNVLVYGFGGIAQLDGVDGSVFGAGTDLKLGNNIVVGVKHTIGEFDNTDTESTMLRVAFKF